MVQTVYSDADLLAAAGAVVVAVIPVLQPLEQQEEFPVFLIPLIGISGKAAKDHQNQTNIGKQCKQQAHDHKPAENSRQDTARHTGAKQRKIQFICAVPALHKLPKEITHIITYRYYIANTGFFNRPARKLTVF